MFLYKPLHYDGPLGFVFLGGSFLALIGGKIPRSVRWFWKVSVMERRSEGATYDPSKCRRNPYWPPLWLEVSVYARKA